jgi:hypothetical protein
MLATCIGRCQNQTVLTKKGQYLEVDARKKIAEELYHANLAFLTRVTKLYEIAAEFPTETKEQLQLRMKDSVDFGARIRSGSLGATIIGGGGSAIGAAIGATIGALLGVFLPLQERS